MYRKTVRMLAACAVGAAMNQNVAVSAEPAETPIATAAYATATPYASASEPIVLTETEAACARGPRFYGSLDYLLFRFRDGPAPPLVQHVPTPLLVSPLPADAAITIFGDSIRQHGFSGVRGNAGFWFTENFAIDGSYAQFETKARRFNIASGGEPSIGRYYVDLTNNQQPYTYLIYSQANGPSGWIDVFAPTKFYHFDANVRVRGTSVFSDRCDYLVGFHYADLREGIFVNDFTQFNDGSGITLTGADRFSTTNQFYGGQIGASTWTELGCGFNLDVTTKLAFGGVRQRALVEGSTVQRINGVVTDVVPGDVLTQPSNIGESSRTRFAVLPELMVKLGYRVFSGVNVTVGYNVMAISSVARAGSAIDEGVNPNLNPYLIPQAQSNAQRPAAGIQGTDFWAQGLTLGVSLQY